MIDSHANDDHLGGPGKCGRLFLKYWRDQRKDPMKHFPEVDIKFKVYRLSDFDQRRGTFYIDFVLMLDWVDPSLELAATHSSAGVANFKGK